MSKTKNKKGVSVASRPFDKPAEPLPLPSSGIDLQPAPPRQWILGSAIILLAGAVLRFYQLGAAAFDHDEGVNGLFVIGLMRDGIYRYNPSAFHGPTLYYLSLAICSINRLFFSPTGVSETALRWGTALVGLATVWLALRLRPWMGAGGSAGAALLIAVSPAAVYFSRFFIHETLFVFFTFGIVVTLLYYHRTADPSYLRLGAASTALLFATKETAFISVAAGPGREPGDRSGDPPGPWCRSRPRS